MVSMVPMLPVASRYMSSEKLLPSSSSMPLISRVLVLAFDQSPRSVSAMTFDSICTTLKSSLRSGMTNLVDCVVFAFVQAFE